MPIDCLHIGYVPSDISGNERKSSGGSRKKYLGGPGPSSFGRQPRLSEITIEPISGVGLGLLLKKFRWVYARNEALSRDR